MTKFDSYRKKTFTNYWNHFSTNPKKSNTFSIFFKNIKMLIRKIIPYSIKIKIYKRSDDIYEMFSSYQTDKDIFLYRNDLLCEIITKFLQECNLK